MNKNVTLDTLVAWAKRRGFVFQTSSIYGGLANNYDYGPYGVQLKNNIRDLWWKTFVETREDIVGLDGAILMQKEVWIASGHVENFNDPLVDDKVSKKRYRADHVIEDWAKKKGVEVNAEAMSLDEMTKYISDNKILSPDGNEMTEVRTFNQMFSTNLGATAKVEDAIVYLRPETAQSIFVNFRNILDTMRVKIPFGIAQVGKAFRNEITKGQFIFRTIETEQMEIEYFIDPKADWDFLMEKWKDEVKGFYMSLGIPESDLRYRQHDDKELSHYSKRTYDLEYEFEFGFKEIFGFAHRTDYDLNKHAEFSKQKLQYRDPQTNEVYTPHVIEPSFGLSRATLVAIYAAYTEENLGEGKSRVVMKFPVNIAPIKVAIFPLQKDEKLSEISQAIFNTLRKKYVCEYDNAGNIGKMYRRQDEIGTPFCVTVDFESINDNAVTIRDRDTMEQVRVPIAEVDKWLEDKLTVE